MGRVKRGENPEGRTFPSIADSQEARKMRRTNTGMRDSISRANGCLASGASHNRSVRAAAGKKNIAPPRETCRSAQTSTALKRSKKSVTKPRSPQKRIRLAKAVKKRPAAPHKKAASSCKRSPSPEEPDDQAPMKEYRLNMNTFDKQCTGAMTQTRKVFDERQRSDPGCLYPLRCPTWKKLHDKKKREVMNDAGSLRCIRDSTLAEDVMREKAPVFIIPYGSKDVVKYSLTTLPQTRILRVHGQTRQNKMGIVTWIFVARPDCMRSYPGSRKKKKDHRVSGVLALPQDSVFSVKPDP
jgi:hypothetical protein